MPFTDSPAAEPLTSPVPKSAVLDLLQDRYPTRDAALRRVALLEAERELPAGTVHVISDIHGEAGKLRHVLQNASGSLRALVEQLFAEELTDAERTELLGVLFYPREMLALLLPKYAGPAAELAFVRRIVGNVLSLIRTLGKRTTLARMMARIPAEVREVVAEMLHGRSVRRDEPYVLAALDTLVRHGRADEFIASAAVAVRDLAVEELVAAGDFWDRGPRGDRVMDLLMGLPNVSITWGNHDAAWLGAALGHGALIAHVLRISCRYRRISQLEEGYGVTMQPLDLLARTAYRDDPATCYQTRGTGLRDDLQIARMHKAAAVVQFKLEGQMIARHPEWELDHRRLLHRIDPRAGTVTIDGRVHTLKDTLFPTVDWSDPYHLSADETKFLDRTRQSFLTSEKLKRHMQFLIQCGAMVVRRDDHLIFHACVAVDEAGHYLPMNVDGQSVSGPEQFRAIERAVVRAWTERRESDADLLWYLWCGPRSPLFGKDRIATFEMDLLADKETHEETKNPYFTLIHDKAFCERLMRDFGCDPERGLIVNGHVPVKVEAGEVPLKRSGLAITIDGAFSEAYGDRGYTLVIAADQTYLAEHHHFESVEAAVTDGVDIIPSIQQIRRWDPPRLVRDTERGAAIQIEIGWLEQLADTYQRCERKET